MGNFFPYLLTPAPPYWPHECWLYGVNPPFNGACFLGVFESITMTDDFFHNCLDQLIDLRHPLAF